MKLITKTAIIASAVIGGLVVIGANNNGMDTVAATMWGNGKSTIAATMWGNEKVDEQVAQSYILQGSNPQQLASVVSDVGGNVSREFPIINAVSALLTPTQADQIKSVDGIRIQDDRTVMTMGLGSLLGKSYSINNKIAEQTEADRVHDMNIKGHGVTIAYIDSGSNMGGEEGSFIFKDTNGNQKVPVKYDAIEQKKTYWYNDDRNGHGTHIGSIIGSSLKSEDGKYNGIAPDAYLLSVRAFDDEGASSYSTVLDALNWIFDNRHTYKIRVVNMSLGAEVQSRYWNDPINQAVTRLWDAGIVVVASAGNTGEEADIQVPGNNPYVITVGAMSDNETSSNYSDDRIASFSSLGPTLDGFVKPDVVAPGTGIAVKMNTRYFLESLKASVTGENYHEISGTSQSAAVVSGIAALIIQDSPRISPDNVKCRIMASARASAKKGKLTFSPFAQGAGLVSAYDAVMSSKRDCANRGMDIKADLAGTKRYLGPVVKEDSGEFSIALANGKLLTNGTHWGNKGMDITGTHWGNEELGLQGTHWGAEEIDLLGTHWGNEKFGLLGTHWGTEEMGLQGTHWGSEEMDLLGTHWGNQEMDLQGADFGDQDLELLSNDSSSTPIDPSVAMPIENEGWN